MADVKRFVIIDENGQIVEQTNTMTIEVDAGATARSVVNKGQLDGAMEYAAQQLEIERNSRIAQDNAIGDSISNLQTLLSDLSSSTSADLSGLTTSLAQEITDRTNADAAEAATREAADIALGLRIDAEELARATADSAETAARQADVSTLTGLISDESSARLLLDTTLRGLITDEAIARAAADATLTSNLAQELIDRAAADTALGLRIDNEIADRTAADTAENARAVAAEGALDTKIDTERTDRLAEVAAERTARTDADTAETAARIAGDAAEAAARDNAIAAAIATEVAARDAAILVEKNRAEAAEALIAGNLAAEITRATGVEGSLRTDLDAEVSTRISEITRVEGLISTEATNRAADVDAEEVRALAAEGLLDGRITAELARATGEEARIEGKYDAGIAAEIAARIAGDDTNAAAITAETARAQAAEGTLANDIAAEASRASTRENSIETALNAEISRATAEEINVENRAKAYADARVQGLKNKDSVDFAFTRFVPNFDRDNESSFVPKFRAGQDWTPAGATEPAIEMFDELGVDSLGNAPYVIFDETGSYGWVALVAPLDGGAPGFRYVGGGGYFKDGVEIDPSPLSAFYDYAANQNPTTEARWNNCLNNGVFVMSAKVEVIDALADDNLEQLFARMSDADTTVSGARVAIVQNGIGASTDWWSGTVKEVVDSGIYTWSHYLVDDAIEALPKGERGNAMLEYLNPADDVDHPFLGHGIYRRTLTAGVASWSRAPDFAVGQEVSGSYVLVEKGLRGGPAEAYGLNPYVNYIMAWSWLDQRKLTQPNTGVVFNGVGASGTSAVVGTNLLVATVFNRVGAYNFSHGLVRHPAEPTTIMVQADRERGISVNGGGVGFDLQDSSNLEFKTLSEYEPNYKGLSLKGPLVGGLGSSIERAENDDGHRWFAHADRKALHSHEASYLMVDFWPVMRAEDLTIDGILPAGTLVAPATVSFGPESAPYGTRNSIAVATWDAPGYIGVADWREDITAWSNFAELSTSYEYVTGVRGRVALSGSGTTKTTKINFVGWDLSGFAVGEMIYVGGGTTYYGVEMSSIAHYSDVPSGKWAIPVGIKLNDNEVKLVDRPAFLKS